MEKTTNYQLNKPEAGDPMRVSDFNENAEIIDAALNTLNTAVAACGNCRIAMGGYAGTGTYGEADPVTITLEFSPKILWIFCERYNSGTYVMGGVYHSAPTDNSIRCFLKGGTEMMAHCIMDNSHVSTTLYYTMENNTFSCYNTMEADVQMNASGKTYHYVAIG